MEAVVIFAYLYFRLSVEEAKNGESESIKNQRSIVRAYCEKHNITVIGEFIDDGYSGSTFDRPDFVRMIKSIETGKSNVNMVITKDLSRLGRNASESMYYAERYFPEHGIRFITVADNFDSNEMSVMAPFQFAMNEVYLRDTSKKIKQVINQKRVNGEYCACAPFGYMKSPDDKGKLIPNPDTADIVKYIFQLAADGISCRAIADILTKENYMTPLQYRVQTGNFSDKGAARATNTWVNTTVKRIVVNPVYLGHTILGKTKSPTIKSKVKVKVPKEEWAVTENTHIPLVSKETFEKAQVQIGVHTKNWRTHPQLRHSIFNGLVFCECCGCALSTAGSVYNGEREKYWYLSCNNASKRSHPHCEHPARVKYADLVEIIKRDLNEVVNLTPKDIVTITNKAIERNKDIAIYEGSADSIKSIQKRLGEIDNVVRKLYNDNITGKISDEMHSSQLEVFTNEANALKQKLIRIEQNKNEEDEIADTYDKFFNLANQFAHFDELTPEIVRTFIERIEVGQKVLPDGYQKATHDNIPYTQDIKIIYRFIGNLKESEQIKNEGRTPKKRKAC
ncbi:MAG: recombinase family protein [Eubacterium sp.]|nr:recombinase family protein [Eubacterium sp.]MBR3150074.1 recombinase family protein [Eubacterium sp.]